MDVQPIRTEADYEAALAEIERLFDAVPNTAEGDRLNVLVTLVEAYEAYHYPVPDPDPVDTIKYVMESRALSRADLLSGVSRAEVAERFAVLAEEVRQQAVAQGTAFDGDWLGVWVADR